MHRPEGDIIVYSLGKTRPLKYDGINAVKREGPDNRPEVFKYDGVACSVQEIGVLEAMQDLRRDMRRSG